MNERLELLRTPQHENHMIGLLAYAPWLGFLVRVWPTALVGCNDVSVADWDELREHSDAALVAASSEYQQEHPARMMAAESNLNELLASMPGGPYRLFRSSRDAEPLQVGDGWLLGRAAHIELCRRDADCGGQRHRWFALNARNGDTLIWHVNLDTFAVVPPTPLRVTE